MKITKIKIAHKDVRGDISDITYKTPIEHISVINSQKGVIRGDHYHKKTVQSMYMSTGSLRYYYREYNKKTQKWGRVKSVVVKQGEMVTTPPWEIHALEILEKNRFLVFTHGTRGGKDYEKDTFRTTPSIIPAKRQHKRLGHQRVQK
jgi:dTDP-4-dehydrorhamnose 3,5-epimerase-like enzyme